MVFRLELPVDGVVEVVQVDAVGVAHVDILEVAVEELDFALVGVVLVLLVLLGLQVVGEDRYVRSIRSADAHHPNHEEEPWRRTKVIA